VIYGIHDPQEVDIVFREMGLPEPFIYARRGETLSEDGKTVWSGRDITGMITGFIRVDSGGHKHLDVDYMIVRPCARRKFSTMMHMSEDAVQAAFREGCAYALVSVFLNDSRLSGLEAWAKRMKFKPWASSDDSRWFIRHNPHYVYESETHGQGREGSFSEASSGGTGSERG
jgi:hypothetical protein